MLLVSILLPIIGGTASDFVFQNKEKVNKFFYILLLAATDLSAALSIFLGNKITLFSVFEKVSFSFELDNLGKYFLAAVLILYTAVCFYSFEYMKKEEHIPTFFAFYFISMGAMIAACMASNLVTLYLCFEMATLTSVPLVLHERDKEAVTAGMKYLYYSVGGALLGLLALFFIYYYGGSSMEFVLGGTLDLQKASGNEGLLRAMIFVGIIGFGTKAGMFPMSGWLPTAHPAAPAPASSLLSGIIAKAGILAVIRLVYYSVGTEFLKGTWVQTTWMILAMITIFMGSMLAFREKHLKKRLAFSTVSQISYIMLALSVLSDEGLQGGLLHVLGHSVSKGCLFLVAGALIYYLNKRYVTDMKGVGQQYPAIMGCFTLVSLSLIGIPPMAGFLSKWTIACATVNGMTGILAYLPTAVLIISALLTAGYLMPVVVDGFFPGKEIRLKREKESLLMVIPMICLCLVSLAVGIFGMQILGWFGF